MSAMVDAAPPPKDIIESISKGIVTESAKNPIRMAAAEFAAAPAIAAAEEAGFNPTIQMLAGMTGPVVQCQLW